LRKLVSDQKTMNENGASLIPGCLRSVAISTRRSLGQRLSSAWRCQQQAKAFQLGCS
jgi:hypothetical protein